MKQIFPWDHVSYSWYMARFFNSEHHCWRILLAKKKAKILPVTVEQSCQWLLNNRISHCWIIVPVTVKQSCQWLLKNRASDYWTILSATVAHNSEPLNNRASDCWIIIPTTVEELWQWLLKNYASDCWRIVPVAADESCQRLLLFLTYFGKILTSFSCKYFNYYWLFSFRITTK